MDGGLWDMTLLGLCEAVCGAENHKITASLSGLYIALVTQETVGVLYGNGADAQFFAQDPLRQEFTAQGKETGYDVLPHLTI